MGGGVGDCALTVLSAVVTFNRPLEVLCLRLYLIYCLFVWTLFVNVCLKNPY